MRFDSRGLVAGPVALAIASYANGQAAPVPVAAPALASASACPAAEVDELAEHKTIEDYKKLDAQDRNGALKKAYFNTAFTRWELSYLNKAKCEIQHEADEAKKVALGDFETGGNSPEVTRKALEAIDRARLMSTRQSLPARASDSAIKQFLLLRRAAADLNQVKEAAQLALLRPAYPAPVPTGLRLADDQTYESDSP